jgi:ADP-ribose pyrophosphatase
MPKKEVLASGKFLSFVKLDGYEMVERKNCTGVVVILPITEQNELVLVEQYRLPVKKRCIELPAGLVNDIQGAAQESMQDAAKRELVEETGYEAREMRYMADWATSCGMTSEMVQVYQALGLTKVGAGGGDEQEDITVHVVPIKGIKNWFDQKTREGLLVDPKIYATLYLISQSQ